MNPIMETFFLPQRSRRIPMDDAKTKAAISGALFNNIINESIELPNYDGKLFFRDVVFMVRINICRKHYICTQ